jgi:hypothetical protein
VQVSEGICGNSRCPEGHAGADAGVRHPVRNCRYDTRVGLNMNDAASGALLAIMRTYMSAVERMPAIVNFNFPPDMGRMTA